MARPLVFGQPAPRADGRLKVTGAARYSAEVKLEGLVYAALVTSTVSHGRVLAIDARAAKAAPGVLAVMTPDDRVKLSLDPLKSKDNDPLHLLQDHQIHYSGQPIAVVIADTIERATHAASLVEVRCESKPAPVDFESAQSAAFAPESAFDGPADAERGDVKQGFAEAEATVEATYTTPCEHHHPMEPHATVASWSGSRQLTLWDTTQAVFNTRNRVAELFGLKPKDVTVLSPFVGGGFGCKGSTWANVVLAAMAAKHVRRPVKLVLSRQEMCSNVGFRPQTRQQVAIGARKDGTLTALSHASVNPTALFAEFAEPCGLLTRMLYACPNVKTTHRLVKLAMGAPTVMRGPGAAPGLFALESALDELAVALKMDPVELRLRNHADRDPDTGQPFSSKSLKQCYLAAAERFGWAKRGPVRSQREGDVWVGCGMASTAHPAYCDKASAMAVLRADGSALFSSGASEVGAGTYTVMAQVAGVVLGLPLNRVRFELGDTRMPEAPPAWGSQQSASVAGAVQLVAELLRDKAVALALADPSSPLRGAKPEDIEVGDGRMYCRSDPTRGETYEALLARRRLPELRVKGSYERGPESARYSKHAFGAVFAEVRVDPELGTVRVSRLTGAYAAGRILNAKLARSQFIGAMTMGLGMALSEESVLDARTARFVTRDLADYHVPVHTDIPAMDVTLVDEGDAVVSRLGSKGIGELGIIGVAAAIANAVFHATGIRVRDLPITPDKLVTG